MGSIGIGLEIAAYEVKMAIALEIGEKYAICWSDDPTVRIVRYRGVKRGFLIFVGIEDGVEYICRLGSVIIREME